MFNLSEIMVNAWGMYRRQYSRRPKFDRGIFQWLLMVSWKTAKAAALKARNPNLAKVETLREQLEMLTFKDSRADIAERRRQILAEIATLTA